MAQQTVPSNKASKNAPTTPAGSEAYEYHVCYFDCHSRLTRVEEFADKASAERFANLQLHDDECWAVVEEVAVQGHLRLVA
ncbi:hypothetical protein [Paenarthrobacter sp. NCHU4564]|uniref:hypothetical protein n=1 Tax=Paenarthrobacter sp. NCHU4564 TaxID=3451353 RepID=UPI003F9D43F8